MQTESLSYNAEEIKEEVPGLSSIADKLAQVLQEARLLLEKLFSTLLKSEGDINLSPKEEEQISSKISKVLYPEKIRQYARVVQLVFQLNYYSRIFKKAEKISLEPQLHDNITVTLKNIEEYRKLIEKKYLA
ncbi:MAG: hypothetical protein ACTSQE_09550 [Candidatus Heimdallarchaeaceae archaeon]